MIARRSCLLSRNSLFKLVTVCTIVAAVLFVFQCLSITGSAQTKSLAVRHLVSSALRDRLYRRGNDEYGDWHEPHLSTHQQVGLFERSNIHMQDGIIFEQSGIHLKTKKTPFLGRKYVVGTWLKQRNRDTPMSNAGYFKGQTRLKFDTNDGHLVVDGQALQGTHGRGNLDPENGNVLRLKTDSVDLAQKWKSVKRSNDAPVHDIHNTKAASASKYNSGNLFMYKGPPIPNIHQQRQYTVSSEQKIEASSSRQKTILLWTPFFGKTNWLHDENFRNCVAPNWHGDPGVPPCRVISDRSLLLNSDAVAMHANDMYTKADLPDQHPIHQRWLFYCQESPKHMNLPLDDFSDTFNYTYLMRADSDYVFRHGGAVLREKPMKKKRFAVKLAGILATKKNLVAARISNCHPLERLQYIAELKKHIDVHFYGACGDRDCPKAQEECNGSKMAQYKFYLAFENSKCRDYITEKFWLPLHHWNSVPIVMGGAGPEDYAKVAPPHSYINTADFDSPKDLARYILLLDRNQTMYDKYFHWRKTHGNRRRKDGTLCQFCADLHNSSKPVQYYTDLKSWYELDSCKSTNETLD